MIFSLLQNVPNLIAWRWPVNEHPNGRLARF
jgi:hypothetical protein